MNVSMSINGNGFSGLAKWFLFVRAYILGWLVPCAMHTLSNASNIARISTCERAITQIYRVFVWACERAHRTRSCENDAVCVCCAEGVYVARSTQYILQYSISFRNINREYYVLSYIVRDLLDFSIMLFVLRNIL